MRGEKRLLFRVAGALSGDRGCLGDACREGVGIGARRRWGELLEQPHQALQRERARDRIGGVGSHKISVLSRHAQDQVGLFHHRGRELPSDVRVDIEPPLGRDLHRLRHGSRPLPPCRSRRRHDRRPIAEAIGEFGSKCSLGDR